MAAQNQITVTTPLLPNLEEYNALLQDIWNRKWITNNGYYHQQLERALAEYLRVPYISLFTNGTLPLITALQALGITEGEVITTPYSFVATSHSIWWNKLKPVFVDIEENTCGMNPTKIEEAITDKTVAIMPVHCYGCPCNMQAIDTIAKKHNLKVIYDAAHAFGVQVLAPEVSLQGVAGGRLLSILEYGDLSTLSFHATKVYNTIEGGAMVMHTPEMKYDVDNLKNFGFRGETTVVAPGINSKMDEMRAAYGLLNLKQVDKAIEARKHVASMYVDALKDVKGIKLFPYEITPFQNADGLSSFSLGKDRGKARFLWNFAYFPILVTEEYGKTRDELYFHMKELGILGRRYFYPLITDFEPYKDYPSAKPENLPVANRIASLVICLPMHHALTEDDVQRVLNCIIQ